MLDIQKTACAWNDGTIIACTPIVTGACMEPSRIVIRDLGDTYVVHCQYWPVSQHRSTVVTPSYTSGDYYPKNELGALTRAWDKFYSRFCLLTGREDRINHLGRVRSGKASLKTECTTLGH